MVAADISPTLNGSRVTFVALFAGAGGMSLGLTRAGLRCVAAAEFDARAGDTYRANLGSSIRHAGLLALGPEDGDVTRLDFDAWAARLRRTGQGVDLVAGGPPCQAYSRVGRGKLNHLRRNGGRSGFLGDPRNRLWSHFFRGVRALSPRAFLIENVPGMLHHGGVNVAEAVCEEGRRLGYQVGCAVLNAAAFGVPQVRERLFVLGLRADLGVTPDFPGGDRAVPLSRGHLASHPVHPGLFRVPRYFHGMLLPVNGMPAVTVREALGDLPPFLEHRQPGYRARRSDRTLAYRPGRPGPYASLMRTWPGFESMVVTDHVCKATPRDYETFAAMQPGDCYPEAVAIAEARWTRALEGWERAGRTGQPPLRENHVPPYRSDCFREKWRKLVENMPSWTVTAHLAKDSYSHIHYDSEQARMITVREAARLQSFPDGYGFSGCIGDAFRQIGNAVPPLLAYGLGRHIVTLLTAARSPGPRPRRTDIDTGGQTWLM